MQECDLDLIYLPNTGAIVFCADDVIECSSVFSYCQGISILSAHLVLVRRLVRISCRSLYLPHSHSSLRIQVDYPTTEE